jgi:hypothetical protein
MGNGAMEAYRGAQSAEPSDREHQRDNPPSGPRKKNQTDCRGDMDQRDPS